MQACHERAFTFGIKSLWKVTYLKNYCQVEVYSVGWTFKIIHNLFMKIWMLLSKNKKHPPSLSSRPSHPTPSPSHHYTTSKTAIVQIHGQSRIKDTEEASILILQRLIHVHTISHHKFYVTKSTKYKLGLSSPSIDKSKLHLMTLKRIPP